MQSFQQELAYALAKRLHSHGALIWTQCIPSQNHSAPIDDLYGRRAYRIHTGPDQAGRLRPQCLPVMNRCAPIAYRSVTIAAPLHPWEDGLNPMLTALGPRPPRVWRVMYRLLPQGLGLAFAETLIADHLSMFA